MRKASGKRPHVPTCNVSMHPFCGVPEDEEGFGQRIFCPKCIELNAPPSSSKKKSIREEAREKRKRTSAKKIAARAIKGGPLVGKSVAFVPEQENTIQGKPWIESFPIPDKVKSNVVYGALKMGTSADNYLLL